MLTRYITIKVSLFSNNELNSKIMNENIDYGELKVNINDKLSKINSFY